MVEHIAHKVVVLFQGHCVMFWMDDLFVKKKDLYFLRMTCRLLQRAHSMSAGVHRSSPSQVPTALLTNALIVLWLLLHRGDLYTNCLLKDAAIFLCVD